MRRSLLSAGAHPGKLAPERRMTSPQPDQALGIRENLRPFLQQLLQVFFVGKTIGMQRTSATGMTIHGASRALAA